MKYLPIREIDFVTNALNFSTPDCHVIGGCDIYTTKAAGSDKKLYKDIENSLESQYESLVRLSASLSPPRHTLSDDGKHSDKGRRSKRGYTAEPSEIDLSRASPFGSFSQINARRTFAYLIATLNASHPDYDFSHLLRPSDFRKERSLRTVMNNLDSTLQNLRPKQTAAMHHLSPPLSNSAPITSGYGSDIWSPSMWKLVDKEMALRQCEKYSYVPDDDPFDGEEGAIWSMHYFFFNKDRKRVCYLYLRGFSVISHSPVHAPSLYRIKAGTGAGVAGSRYRVRPRRASTRLSASEGAGKRASFWLNTEMLSRTIDTVSYGDDDDDDDEMAISELDDDDEVEVPFMNFDDVRSDLIDGRWSYTLDEEDEYDDTWKVSRHVRHMSEEIGDAMEMDL